MRDGHTYYFMLFSRESRRKTCTDCNWCTLWEFISISFRHYACAYVVHTWYSCRSPRPRPAVRPRLVPRARGARTPAPPAGPLGLAHGVPHRGSASGSGTDYRVYCTLRRFTSFFFFFQGVTISFRNQHKSINSTTDASEMELGGAHGHTHI